MTDLRERIYSDAVRAAAEITEADIPPLDLAGATGRRFTGRPGNRPLVWSGATGGRRSRRAYRSRRLLIPLAAAASVAAVVAGLVIAGPGIGSSGRPTGTGSGHRTKLPSGGRQASLISAEALDSYFPASGATYTRGLAFRWLERKITARDIDSCLATAGFPQPPFRTPLKQYQLSFFSGQFIDLAQLAAHPGQHAFTGYPVVKHPTAARMKRFEHAQARCAARYAWPVTRVDKAAANLENAWITIVTRIQGSHRISALRPAFARCLERHGVPARYATQVNGSSPVFAGYYAWADTLNQSAPTAARLAADQRHENLVLVACARPAVSLMEQAQLAARSTFFRQHAAQIARIRRLAGRMTRPVSARHPAS